MAETWSVKRTAVLLASLALIPMSGCDNFISAQKKPVAATAKRGPAIHRFTLTRGTSDVAIDSQTGQICRTWDWQVLGKASKPDPLTGNVPERKWGELAPTCLSLYQQFPSGSGEGTTVVQDASP